MGKVAFNEWFETQCSPTRPYSFPLDSDLITLDMKSVEPNDMKQNDMKQYGIRENNCD